MNNKKPRTSAVDPGFCKEAERNNFPANITYFPESSHINIFKALKMAGEYYG